MRVIHIKLFIDYPELSPSAVEKPESKREFIRGY